MNIWISRRQAGRQAAGFPPTTFLPFPPIFGGRILNWTISLPYLPPFVGDFNWQFPLPHPPSLSGIYWVKFPQGWGIFLLYRRRRRLHQRKIFWHFDTQFQKGCLTWYWTSAEIKAKANIKLKEIKTEKRILSFYLRNINYLFT